ncbi:MAG: hypothetical protein HQL37_14965, partial [Alphaproteobacteria bacterium]|nr:hypothetical protein [Alphaproteobacteria bacterium]
MLGATIPLPPEWLAKNQPKDPVALRVQANRDRSAGLDALVNDFLPRLREASTLLRSKRGRVPTMELKKASAAIEKLRKKVRNTLQTQASRDWFDTLSNNAVAIESNAMARHATNESWRWRAETSEAVLRSRIDEVKQFPEDDSRCREAVLDGIA